MTVEHEKLMQLLKEELIKELRHVYIKYENRDLVLFGDYRIRKNKDERYEVTNSFIDESLEVFNSVKNAVTYSVLHKNGKREDVKKLVYLDTHLDTIELEIKIHTNIYHKATDVGKRGIYLTKLQTDYIKKKQVLEDLKTIINSSKQQQRNIFQNYAKSRYKKGDNFEG